MSQVGLDELIVSKTQNKIPTYQFMKTNSRHQVGKDCVNFVLLVELTHTPTTEEDHLHWL